MRKERTRKIWEKRKSIYGEDREDLHSENPESAYENYSELVRLRKRKSPNKVWSIVKSIFVILGFLTFIILMLLGILDKVSWYTA